MDDARRRRRDEWPWQWVGGITFIAIGLALLLRNLGLVEIGNWWALFFLIPAAGSFATAWQLRSYSYAAMGPFFGGLAFLALGAIFLFELPFGRVWPVFLVLLGLLWRRLNLSNLWLTITFWLAVYGTFANWLATFLAAFWAAGSLMPIAGMGRHGSSLQEGAIRFLLVTLSAATIAVCAIVIVGLRSG